MAKTLSSSHQFGYARQTTHASGFDEEWVSTKIAQHLEVVGRCDTQGLRAPAGERHLGRHGVHKF